MTWLDDFKAVQMFIKYQERVEFYADEMEADRVGVAPDGSLCAVKFERPVESELFDPPDENGFQMMTYEGLLFYVEMNAELASLFPDDGPRLH